MGAKGDKEAVRSLVRVIECDDELAGEALDALGAIADESAARALLEICRKDDEDFSGMYLGGYSNRGCLEDAVHASAAANLTPYIEALRDEDVGHCAAEIVGEADDPESVGPVLEIGISDPRARDNVADVLRSLDSTAARVLLETLKRPDLDDDARSWLSRVGVEIGVGPEVRSAIDYGTSLPAPSDPIEQLVSHLLFGDGNTRAHALAGLLLLSNAAVKPIFDDAVVEALEEMVAGPDLSVRLDAIRLLGRKGSWYMTYFDFIYYHLPLAEEIEAGGGVRPDWVALVVAALDDPDEDVRIVAINHIAKLQFPAKIDLLESALHDGDHRVTWWAARGLSEILGTGHPAFLSWVRSALSDQDYRARSCAAQALTGPTDPCLVRPLVLYLLTEPLDHSDGPMGSAKTQSTGRWSAARALQRVEAKQAADVDTALRAAETDDASVADSEGVASASAGPGSLSGWLHTDWVVRAVDVAAASVDAASLLTSGVAAAQVIECTGLGDFVVRFCSTQGSGGSAAALRPSLAGRAMCTRPDTVRSLRARHGYDMVGEGCPEACRSASAGGEHLPRLATHAPGWVVVAEPRIRSVMGVAREAGQANRCRRDALRCVCEVPVALERVPGAGRMEHVPRERAAAAPRVDCGHGRGGHPLGLPAEAGQYTCESGGRSGGPGIGTNSPSGSRVRAHLADASSGKGTPHASRSLQAPAAARRSGAARRARPARVHAHPAPSCASRSCSTTRLSSASSSA